MNRTLIYLAGHLLDLAPNTVVAQTLKRFNVGDLVTRSANYTNTFKIPLTPNNKIIYEHSDNVNSDSTIPYTKQPTRIVQSGVELVSNGLHNIRKINDIIEAFILSDTAGFFEELGNKKLVELDFEGLNGSWNSNDIENYRLNTTGIVAPVMDYGNFTGTNIHVDSYLPSVYYHTIINKIFEQAGYEKDGIVFSDDKYLKTIIAYSREEFRYDKTFVNARSASAKVATSQSIPTPGAGVIVNFGETVIQDEKGYWNGSNAYEISETDANAAGKFLFLFDLLATIDITVAGGTVDINVVDSDAGTLISLTNKGTGVYTINSKDYALGDLAINLLEGENLTIKIATNSGTPAVTVNAGSIVINALDYVGTGSNTFTYFNYLLPDMTQKDFIKDFLISHALIPSEVGNTITCKSLNEIIEDKVNAKDWTSKRVAGKPDIVFDPLGYAQTNYFRYSSAGDSFDHDGTLLKINKDLGLGTFTISNLNAVNQKTVHDSPFNNTHTEIVGGIMMARIPIFDGAGNLEFINEPGLRKLLVRSKYSFEPSVAYFSIVSPKSDYLVAYFESPDEDYTMSWQQFLDDWYSEFIRSLQKAKIVTREYYLTELDIRQIDFMTPIFDTDSYYLINEVKNFIPGQSTKVELFKII